MGFKQQKGITGLMSSAFQFLSKACARDGHQMAVLPHLENPTWVRFCEKTLKTKGRLGHMLSFPQTLFHCFLLLTHFSQTSFIPHCILTYSPVRPSFVIYRGEGE